MLCDRVARNSPLASGGWKGAFWAEVGLLLLSVANATK